MESFASIVSRNREIGKIGIGIDIREKGTLSEINSVLKTLRKKFRPEVLFLEAEKNVLIRRFRETRRPHPLGGDIDGAIQTEKERLSHLRDAADRIVDTSSYTPHQLRQLVSSTYGIREGKQALTVILISFGFKFGAPQNTDLLFDARFLPNPNFVPELKSLRGTDRKVADYVLKNATSAIYVRKIQGLLDFLIPRYISEGRSYVTIGVGCTGGNHRSPAIAEKLMSHLRKYPVDLGIIHRDMN